MHSPDTTPVTTASDAQENKPLNILLKKEEKEKLQDLLKKYRDTDCKGKLPEFLALFLSTLSNETYLGRPFDLGYTPKEFVNRSREILAENAEYFLKKAAEKYTSIQNLCQFTQTSLDDAAEILNAMPAITDINSQFDAFFKWCSSEDKSVHLLKEDILHKLKSGFIFNMGAALGNKLFKSKTFMSNFVKRIGQTLSRKDGKTFPGKIIEEIYKKLPTQQLDLSPYTFNGEFANSPEFPSIIQGTLDDLAKHEDFLTMSISAQDTTVSKFYSEVKKARNGIENDTMKKPIEKIFLEFEAKLKTGLKFTLTWEDTKKSIEVYKKGMQKKINLGYPEGFNTYLQPIREKLKKTPAFQALQETCKNIQTKYLFVPTARAQKLNPFMHKVLEGRNDPSWIIEMFSRNHPDFSACEISQLYNSEDDKATGVQNDIDAVHDTLKQIVMDQFQIAPADWDSQLKLWQKAYWENTLEYKIAEFVRSEEFYIDLLSLEEFIPLDNFIRKHFKNATINEGSKLDPILLGNVLSLVDTQRLKKTKLFTIITNDLSALATHLENNGHPQAAEDFRKLYMPVILKSHELVKTKLNGQYTQEEKEAVLKKFIEHPEAIDIALNKGKESPRKEEKTISRISPRSGPIPETTAGEANNLNRTSSTKTPKRKKSNPVHEYLKNELSNPVANSQLMASINRVQNSQEFKNFLNFVRKNFEHLTLTGDNISETHKNAVLLIQRIVLLAQDIEEKRIIPNQKIMMIIGNLNGLKDFDNLLLMSDKKNYDAYRDFRKKLSRRVTTEIINAYNNTRGEKPSKFQVKEGLAEYIQESKDAKTLTKKIHAEIDKEAREKTKTQTVSSSSSGMPSKKMITPVKIERDEDEDEVEETNKKPSPPRDKKNEPVSTTWGSGATIKPSSSSTPKTTSRTLGLTRSKTETVASSSAISSSSSTASSASSSGTKPTITINPSRPLPTPPASGSKPTIRPDVPEPSRTITNRPKLAGQLTLGGIIQTAKPAPAPAEKEKEKKDSSPRPGEKS